jgi:hypothetical protein
MPNTSLVIWETLLRLKELQQLLKAQAWVYALTTLTVHGI